MPLWLTIGLAVAGLLTHAVGLISITANAVRGWFRKELNGMSERIDREIRGMKETHAQLAQSAAARQQAVEEAGRKLLQNEFVVAQLQRDYGKLEGVLSQIAANLERSRDVRHEHEKELTRQLAQLETNMNVADALREIGERIADRLVGQKQGGHRGDNPR